jgi:hypothetical protein
MDPIPSHTRSDAPLALDALPDGSRIWVYAANRPFTESERSDLEALLTKVRGKWDIKQPGMRGCHEFVEDRFVIVGADESREMLDGCSVDAMTHFVVQLEAQTGLRLMDRMTVHYRDADGAVQSVSRPDFAARVASGDVTAGTHVFDTTIHAVEQFRGGRFEVPMSETWHGQAFL